MTIYSRPWNWSPSGQMLTGQCRTDTSDWISPTQVWVHSVTQDGVDVEPQLAMIGPGCTIRLQVKADSTRYLLCDVSGPGTDNGTYWSFPVSLNDTQGQPPNSGQALEVFVMTPDVPGVLPPNARVCSDYDANGNVVHIAPVRYIHDDPNTMPDIYWCQHCHQVFVTVDPQWSV